MFLGICVVTIGAVLGVAAIFALSIGLVIVLSNPIGGVSVLTLFVVGLVYGGLRFWEYKRDRDQ